MARIKQRLKALYRQLISQNIGMEFGKLINGQTIKEVDDEGYKYLAF